VLCETVVINCRCFIIPMFFVSLSPFSSLCLLWCLIFELIYIFFCPRGYIYKLSHFLSILFLEVFLNVGLHPFVTQTCLLLSLHHSAFTVWFRLVIVACFFHVDYFISKQVKWVKWEGRHTPNLPFFCALKLLNHM